MKVSQTWCHHCSCLSDNRTIGNEDLTADCRSSIRKKIFLETSFHREAWKLLEQVGIFQKKSLIQSSAMLSVSCGQAAEIKGSLLTLWQWLLIILWWKWRTVISRCFEYMFHVFFGFHRYLCVSLCVCQFYSVQKDHRNQYLNFFMFYLWIYNKLIQHFLYSPSCL